MVAIDRDRAAAREASMLGEHLLTVAGIYGPNASGKTNVLLAMKWLSDAIRDSMRMWDNEIPVECFAFDDAWSCPTEFIIELLIDGVRFEYAIELDRKQIHYEGLFHYPEKKRRRIFERTGLDLTLQRGLGDLAGTRQLLTPRTSALAAAHRFDEPLVSGFADALLAIQLKGTVQEAVPSLLGLFGAGQTNQWFDAEGSGSASRNSGSHEDFEKDRQRALELLRLADLGIEDVVFTEESRLSASETEPDSWMIKLILPTRRPRLTHRTSTGPTPLEFTGESSGTRNWYQMIGPLLDTLRSGSILVLDEIDASLHPTLSAQLLQLFHDPATNPLGAQLIFTTHDTNLLNHLNRDEVWFTEKASTGATRLGALAEFAGERVRKSQNLETAYLHGRFGALPDIDRADLLRALGLIA
ncbi:ATP-binding protein [Nocardia panacis]|uniref:ATP-binding protein n=2 Tax=Nocardia panacis TaxID=2340916 RepID=A0A3A4K4X5_9NOCA|nr:ATP-binding protein [Nocardia panacis]